MTGRVTLRARVCLKKVEAPEELAAFALLVQKARERDDRSITESEYKALQAEYLRARHPITSPLFGWYYANRIRLRKALERAGIAISASDNPERRRRDI